jgi:hypothetical protein
MPYSPGANNQSYLDPAANTQRNNITSALMRTAAPPPQTQMPGMAPAMPGGVMPPQIPPQMPPPGNPVPQLPGAAMPGMPTPNMPPPNVPLSAGVPPVQQPGMMPQGAMPAPGPQRY